MWLYSGKICRIRAKVVVFRQSGCNRAKSLLFGQKWLYSGRVVVFGQKMVVFRQSGCIRAKMVVFGQKWLYSGKVVAFEGGLGRGQDVRPSKEGLKRIT